MAVWIVTGNLGGGKTLVCVGKISDYLGKGRLVATNLDIKLHKMFKHDCKKLRLIRLPDKPSAADFEIIGKGNTSPDESKNGLIVLDECGTWFNSRTWGDKERQPLIDWLLHSRKFGWDIMFIIQEIGILDKQVRLTLAEHTVFCRRLDRLNIPFIGPLFSLFTLGERLPLPRIHIGIVKYGNNDRALIVDRWVYRGNGLFQCYDTKQRFSDSYPHGPFSYLPPWHTHGYRSITFTPGNYMRMTKIYWKRFRSPAAFALGSLIVAAYYTFTTPSIASVVPRSAPVPTLEVKQFESAKIISYVQFPGQPVRAVLQLGEKRIQTNELIAQGYLIAGDSSRLIITAGEGGQYVSIYR